MSFGYSVSDIIAAGHLCWSVYRACRDAAGNYKDVTAELESLHINLKNLADEVGNPKSLLNRRGLALQDEFKQILENVQASLKELEQMVLKYRSLGTMEKRTWDRLRFGLKELNTIRQKLTYHTAQIKLFLGNLMMGSMGRIETLLEEFVREIRTGKRAPTLLSIEQGGDEATIGWKRLESDLSDSGVPSEDIDRHRDDIEEYLAQLTTDLVLNSVGSTTGLEVGGHPDGLCTEPVLEDNWDSISQRMTTNGDSEPQTEQSNDEKSDTARLVTARRAENDPKQTRSRGLSPESLSKNSILLETLDMKADGQDSGKRKFHPHRDIRNTITLPSMDPINQAPTCESDSGDDEDVSSTRKRPKLQNRTSQASLVTTKRWLREQYFLGRKELHINDFEAEIAALKQSSASIIEENEILKLQLQKTSTEYEILKATSQYSNRESLPSADPIRFFPTDFYSEVLLCHESKKPSHRIVVSDSGERLLAAGAAWDFIIKSPLYIQGLVDVGDVSERLKGVAKCDGEGPIFEEAAIIKAIEDSVASLNDDLL